MVTLYAFAAFASYFLIESVGRRKMFIWGSAFQSIGMILLFACIITGSEEICPFFSSRHHLLVSSRTQTNKISRVPSSACLSSSSLLVLLGWNCPGFTPLSSTPSLQELTPTLSRPYQTGQCYLFFRSIETSRADFALGCGTSRNVPCRLC